MRLFSRIRPGTSLIELMIVTFISVSLMGVLVTLVSRVIRTNGTFSEHLEDATSLGELSEQFRRDVHGAAKVSLEDNKIASQRLSIQMADGSKIDYEPAEGGLTRTAIAADEQKRSESFSLHGMKVLGWKQSSSNAREVSMLIDRLDSSRAISRGQPIEITAATVRDRRVTGAPQ